MYSQQRNKFMYLCRLTCETFKLHQGCKLERVFDDERCGLSRRDGRHQDEV